MNITYTHGLSVTINIYDKIQDGCIYCVAKGSGMEVGVLKYFDSFSNEYNHYHLVSEALEKFCLKWLKEYKCSNIMIRDWVVAQYGPKKYVAISL